MTISLGSPCYSSVSSWTTHENDLTLSADFELFKEIGAPARRVPPQLTSGQTVIKSPDSQMLDEQRVWFGVVLSEHQVVPTSALSLIHI